MSYSSEYEIKERSYGKEFIRLIEVTKDGDYHTMKEYNIDMKVTLDDSKEYWTHDNSDIVCAGSLQDTLFILANNFGLKSPEEFGILSCNHFFFQYKHVENISLFIEEFAWNRISYDSVNFHNHAFIHKPECSRTCTIAMNRKDMKAVLESGVKGLHVAKTTKATFLGFYDDEYRTAPQLHDRVLSTKMSFTWKYKDEAENIDFDKVWETAKNAALENWAGDVIEGAYKSSTQFSAQEAQRSVLNAVPEIKSVDMSLPNLIYIGFDFSRFPENLVKKNVTRQIMIPSLPSAFGFSRMVRKELNGFAKHDE